MITNTELEYKGNLYPDQIKDYKQDSDKFYFTSENGVILEITVVRNSTIRFRYATDHTFHPDFSYAVSPNALRGYSRLEASETKTEYLITTAKVKILFGTKTLLGFSFKLRISPKYIYIPTKFFLCLFN